MRIAYFIVFGWTAAVGLILTVAPQLLIIAMLMFMVIGPLAIAIVYPLMAMPSIALYLTLLLPWAVAGEHSANARNLLVGGLAAIGALAILPSFFSQMYLSETVSLLSKNDLTLNKSAVPPFQPNVVELVEPNIPGNRRSKPTDRAPCTLQCQTILAEGLAQTVVITRIGKKPRPRRSYRRRRKPAPVPNLAAPIARMAYRLEPRTECTDVLPRHAKTAPILVSRIAAGSCLVADAAVPSTPDLVFERSVARRTVNSYQLKRSTNPTDVGRSWLIGTSSAERLTVKARTALGDGVIHRQTMVRAETIHVPTLLYPSASFNGYGKNGMFLWRDKTATKPFIYQLEVVHWLERLKAGQWPDPDKRPAALKRYEQPEQRLQKRNPSDDKTVLLALLKRPGTQPFSSGAHAVLNKWANSIRRERTLSSGERAIVAAVLKDNRFTDLAVLASVLRGKAATLSDLLPQILERIEQPIPERRGHSHSALGYLVPQMPTDTLMPYADRIIRIVQSEERWHMNGLLAVVGQLGRDTTALLRSRFESKHGSTVNGAIKGICRADTTVAAPLIPLLLSEFEAAAEGQRGARGRFSILARALIRHGRKADVIRILDKQADERRRRRVSARDLKRDAGFDPKFCR
ncbi:MAG: hypothetical protein KDJ36_11710 [Hyphomicrobiaceae bacterium]|nr:hypothetical protein [Hyphomicrobiaceae bacterium]